MRSFSSVARVSFSVNSHADCTSASDMAAPTPASMLLFRVVRRPGTLSTESGKRCSIELRIVSVAAPLTVSSLAIS